MWIDFKSYKNYECLVNLDYVASVALSPDNTVRLYDIQGEYWEETFNSPEEAKKRYEEIKKKILEG